MADDDRFANISEGEMDEIGKYRGSNFLDQFTSPGLAYSQILLARIYEPLVLVNTVIS